MGHLDTLNQKQREAVLHTEGPLLVLAGAGSGKTRVITHRILHLLERGVAPHQILAVTFTNKAAKEMRERLAALIATHLPGATLTHPEIPVTSTFHALGVRILRDHHAAAGLRRHFTIYDRADAIRAIKQAIERVGENPKQFEPRRLLGMISRAKGDALSLDTYTERAHSYPERVASAVWREYTTTLKQDHALDFDDLLLETLRLLRGNPDVLAHYHDRFSYIHVDEYQDTNKVQYEIARLLARRADDAANICVVGDVDQNIYSWRGADIANIMQFEKHFPGTKIVLLEENYRSTQTIIAASNDIIEKNKNRVPKTVFTNNQEGEPISLYAAYNESDEAAYVAQTAKQLIRDGAPASSIAVLFRANYQSRALEDAFLSASVPYQLLGVRFYERKEIKDVLSYLRLALNPESMADLNRIINEPARGIGKVTLLKILEGGPTAVTGAAAKKVGEFFALMEEIRECAGRERASEVIKFIIRRTGMEELLRKGGEEELERLENLRELASLATRYDEYAAPSGIEALIEDAALQSDQDELKVEDTKDAVKLMTIHAAKGLEFSYVFITGLEEGLFPHERLSDERTDMEEERRLFYVALTRAQKKIFLSFAGIRTVFGSQRINIPSSFLADISDTHLESANPQESGYERTIYLD